MTKLRVKEILKEKGITGRDFCISIGMSEVGFYKMLSESGNPPLNRLIEIATALNVEIVDLFDNPKSANLKCPHCGGDLNVKIE